MYTFLKTYDFRNEHFEKTFKELRQEFKAKRFNEETVSFSSDMGSENMFSVNLLLDNGKSFAVSFQTIIHEDTLEDLHPRISNSLRKGLLSFDEAINKLKDSVVYQFTVINQIGISYDFSELEKILEKKFEGDFSSSNSTKHYESLWFVDRNNVENTDKDKLNKFYDALKETIILLSK